MAATAFVRARVDEDIKNQAAAVLAGMGLTVNGTSSQKISGQKDRCQNA